MLSAGARPRRRGVRLTGRRIVLLLVLAAVLVLVVGGWRPVARAAAGVLVVDEPLRPAAAIVVLQGGTLYRDQEAASLYADGWAPRVYISRDVPTPFITDAHRVGIAYPTNHDVAVQVYQRAGVPESAVTTLPRDVDNTVQELRQVAEVVGPGQEPLIFVTSPTHSRRVLLLWRRIMGDRRPAIVRTTRYDRFDATNWWRTRGDVMTVIREYLALANFMVGSPERA